MVNSKFSSITAVSIAFLLVSQLSLSSYAASPISNAAADYVASQSAQVRWQTGEGAAGQVEYSTDSNFANSLLTPLDPALVTSHYVNLTGLIPNTTYYCRIRSGSDSTVSSIFSFKTLPSTPSTWPPNKGIGSTPVIQFSADERTVSISYKNKTDNTVNNFTFYRPVISDWIYVPQGNVYWVDGTSGSDTSQGTGTSPLKTITKAISLVKAGDIIYVKAGTYVEPVAINKSGQQDKPIILSAAPGDLGKVRIMLPPKFCKK